MSEIDCLKLTAYFGERDRNGRQLLADQLLDLYGGNQLRASVLLRGINGFGLKHHLHTDQLLSMSDDLPVVAVAVDTRQRINDVLPEVLAIKHHGLVTLERAKFFSEHSSLAAGESREDATKLTVYLGRQERVFGTAAYAALCDLLYRRGVSGATVLLGVDGTRNGQRVRARFFGTNANVPLMLIAVAPCEVIDGVLPELGGLLREPLITLERVRVCKRDGELLIAPHELPGADEHGLPLWQKLMVHTSETARYRGRPLHRVLIEELRRENVAGATCIRGIWGFHGNHPPHGDKLVQKYRHTPVVTIVVDAPDRIATAFHCIDRLTTETGLVTSEVVPAAEVSAEGEVRGTTAILRRRGRAKQNHPPDS